MSSVEEKNLIIDENLTVNDGLISDALEKRVAHISDKAELVIGLPEDEARKTYGEVFGFKDEQNCIAENGKYVFAVRKGISLYDKLNCIDSFYPDDEADIFEEAADAVFESDTVSYMKNPLADVAYNNFSKLLNDPRVAYGETFSDVCEDVYYSRVPYCILPLVNSEDGRMAGFGNMIRKYGLKIVLTCSVESANGKITVFALLKRELARLKCKKEISEGEYLAIGVNFGEEQRLQDVLQAASYFGFVLNKIDSLPIYYSEKEYYFDIVFSGNGDLKKFLFWLELEVPRYEVMGVYTQIKTIRSKRGG